MLREDELRENNEALAESTLLLDEIMGWIVYKVKGYC